MKGKNLKKGSQERLSEAHALDKVGIKKSVATIQND